MPAYIIANQTITDPEAFGKYAQAAGPTVAAFGGKCSPRVQPPR